MGTVLLVVEDEALIADDIQRTLQRLGYDVPLTVATGREAIKAAKDIRPQLVLMDIKLQGHMDGIDAAIEIRRTREVPIIYLTSHSDDATLARAMAAAPSGYLLKPFGDRELKTAIEVALYKHQLETKLAEREEWLSAILHSIGDAVIVTDPDGVITVMNPIAEKLTRWSRQSAVGRKVGDVFRFIDSSDASIEGHATGNVDLVQGRSANRSVNSEGVSSRETSAQGDTRLVRSDGSELPVSNTFAPISGANGTVTGAVLVFRDITREKLEQERLEALMMLDPLTGIANRRALEIKLGWELARGRRYDRPLACLMMDIDNFKSINDNYGHAVGDSVLAAVASILPGELRAGVDLVARYGGEEFVILLPETSLSGAVTTAERVRQRVEMEDIAPHKLHVTVSVGVATGSTEDLQLRADRAMYLAKRNGRNRVEVWNDLAGHTS